MPTYLLTGNEPYLINQKIKEFKDKVQMPEMNISKFEQFDEHTAAACEQFPCMEDHRLILVEGDILRGDNADLLNYLKNESTSTVLVMIPTNIDKRVKAYKALKKHGSILEFKKVNCNELQTFIFEKLNLLGAVMDLGTVNYFIQRTGYLDNKDISLYDVVSEIQKLALYNKNITKDIVDRLVMKNITDNIFKLTNCIMNKDAKSGFELLNSLLENGESSIALMSLILQNFRVLYKLSVLPKDDNPTKELGANNVYHLRNFNLSTEVVNICIDACIDKIDGIKQGRYDSKLAPKILLAEIFNVVI